MVDTHRYVGNHAAEILGVMREPGEMLTLSKEDLEDSHVADHLESGQIVDLKSFAADEVPTNDDEGGEKLNG